MSIFRLLYKYVRFWGGPYKCIICNHSVRKFFPFSHDLQKGAHLQGFHYDFTRIETLNYEQYTCPFCLSSDRERLYLIYLENYLKEASNNSSILDFAPNKNFSTKLRHTGHTSYTSTDFFRDDVDLRMDICNMSKMSDDSFDIIICSHILEHVEFPDKALSEIRRILKPGGKAIVMVPLFWDVRETVEDKSHTTPELRLKHYGQEDHVRLFSRKDFLERLKIAGFKVDELRVNDFESARIKENAIADNSILYVCS